jgi:hypothetical protein
VPAPEPGFIDQRHVTWRSHFSAVP